MSRKPFHREAILKVVLSTKSHPGADGNKHNHYHFRCEKCGRLFDLDEFVDRTKEVDIAQKTGFKVKRHHLEIIGLC